MMSGPITFLARSFAWLFTDINTAEFLKERSATVTVQTAGGQSFYVIKVTPVTRIGMKDGNVLLRVKLLSEHQLRVIVSRKGTRHPLVDVTLPLTAAAGTINLDLIDFHLKIQLDADPSTRNPG